MAKILYLGLSGQPSGGTRILIEHLNHLTNAGHECEFAMLVPSPVDWMPAEFGQSLFDSQRTERFDVVVATEINTWQVVADPNNFPRADRRKVFVQMMEHLFFPRGSETYEGFQKKYDVLGTELQPFTISEWLAKRIEGITGVMPPIVKNGVNTDMFFPDEDGPVRKRTKVLIEGHGFSPLTNDSAGQNQAKDVMSMSERTARFLRSQGDDIEIVGFSPYPQPTDLYDRYWRNPTQQLIRAIYASSDVILKATRFEGRSCVDVEAMACGCAVNRAITYGRDDLLHGFNCLLADYGNLTEFSANALRIVRDLELRKGLRKNGLEYVREYLDWNKIIPVLEKALLE